MKQIVLHIGTHKTGSTSLQKYLFDREAHLLQQGIALYHGQHIDDNHIELYLASMRYSRDSFGKQSLSNLVVDESYTEAVAARVKAFIKSSAAPRILLTTEGLSLLRHPDELERLRYILGGDEAEVSVVLYLREKSAYLDSYRKQLYKKEGRMPSKDYWSALYIEPDTWLTDYETLIKVYRDAFGDDQVTVIDYDEEMKTEGNIIPSFLKAIAVTPEVEGDSATYFENRTQKQVAPSLPPPAAGCRPGRAGGMIGRFAVEPTGEDSGAMSTTRDNADYWVERHEKHANKMVSVGDIRRSEEENMRLYAGKKRTVYSILHAIDMHVLMGRRVLDAGCGIGLVSELFYALGAQVSGVDASPVAIENAAFRCPDGEFQAASIVDFQFGNKFDIVFSADVLYHVVDDGNWKAAVHNLLDHCVPGGWLILIDQLRAEVTSPAPHVRYRTRELYREIMAGTPAHEVMVPGFERVVVYRKAS